MDKRFLEVIAIEYIDNGDFWKNAPSTDSIIRGLEKYMSETVVEEIEDIVYQFAYDISLYAVLNGMQVASDISDGKYSHKMGVY